MSGPDADGPATASPLAGELSFRLDGERLELSGIPPLEPLLDLLRDRLGRRSARRGCGDGQCGACSLLLDGLPVCACLVPACHLEGREVTTAAGLAADPRFDALHRALGEVGGIQCGFCTPGILVSAYALLSAHPDPSREQVRRALAGNLCRCTGYQRVVDGVMLAARSLRDEAHGS